MFRGLLFFYFYTISYFNHGGHFAALFTPRGAFSINFPARGINRYKKNKNLLKIQVGCPFRHVEYVPTASGSIVQNACLIAGTTTSAGGFLKDNI